MRLRIVVPQRVQDRRNQHKISEVHEVDDENVLIQSHCSSNESPCSISCHDSVRRIAIRVRSSS